MVTVSVTVEWTCTVAHVAFLLHGKSDNVFKMRWVVCCPLAGVMCLVSGVFAQDVQSLSVLCTWRNWTKLKLEIYPKSIDSWVNCGCVCLYAAKSGDLMARAFPTMWYFHRWQGCGFERVCWTGVVTFRRFLHFTLHCVDLLVLNIRVKINHKSLGTLKVSSRQLLGPFPRWLCGDPSALRCKIRDYEQVRCWQGPCMVIF